MGVIEGAKQNQTLTKSIKKQTKSIAPSVKAVIITFHYKFSILSSVLWFGLWRLVSISMCFCRVEQCSQSQTHLLISRRNSQSEAFKSTHHSNRQSFCSGVVFSTNHLRL